MNLFEAVEPRDDVREGTITDAVFAANLDEVVGGTAPPVYGDARRYFETSHPSTGMKALLNTVIGRLTGKRADASPILRLETNLGGGKTHVLIGLYHAVRGDLPADLAERFMDPTLRPAEPAARVGVFVGTSAGATSFPEIDGVRAKTVWGYLTLQIGGSAAYELLREDDEALTAPGSSVLKEILSDGPTLVLLDELARYLQTSQGVTVGGSTLAAQTVSWLMAMMEAVDSLPNASLAITMTETTDPFGGSTQSVVEALNEAEAQSLISRKAQSLRPSDEADLPAILRRRLFEDTIDPGVPTAVAAAYSETMSEAYGRGTDLPDRAVSGGQFLADVEKAYPFHPDLLHVLDKRLSTIPDFNRTRGALRLLARAVRLLWAQEPANTQLIHLHHLDLSSSELAEELSSRIDRAKYEPVIRADIRSRPGGSASHAEELDQRLDAPYATRLATAAYLYSLTADVPGVPAPELLGSVLAPGDDPGILTKALDQLEQSCWYLHTDTRGYRFSTEWSLVKRVQEAESQISLGKVKARATEILSQQFRDSALKVKRTWEDPKVPDHADDAYLILLHWDELTVGSADEPTPDKIRTLWEKTPSGGNRSFRNRLIFLAPSAAGHEAMLRAVRTHLALKQLAASDLSDVSAEKRAELKQRAGESDATARIAVCNHVNILYVPEKDGLEGYGLDQVTQASLKPNQTDAILDRLSSMEKTLAAGDRPLDPLYVRSKLGTQAEKSLPTEELARIFARRSDLKLVLDKGQLRTLVAEGIRQGVWEYQDLTRGDDGWATKDKPNVNVRLADDTLLHPSGSAPDTGPPPCPLCGAVHTGACPGAGPGGAGPGPGKGTGGADPDTHFQAEGSAAVAFSTARQAAADAKQEGLRTVHFTVDVSEGAGQQLARLHALVPPGTPGSTVRYEVAADVELDTPEHRLKMDFVGSPEEYQPLKSAMAQVLGSRPAVLRAILSATFDPPAALEGQEVEDLKRRAQDTGPSHCRVDLETGSDS